MFKCLNINLNLRLRTKEDLPDDFFAKVPSAADDVTKCSGGQFEDGEFGIEE
ncbi:hypothetical protein F2Q70_00016522 [Brassica cretica]|uniref:Uncharacterized protein n=1 Tax=Brassica cretica TaxID=69181 RepID=A0A8S9HY07_BRACR|nr:hypothetical protein F2Q70_00016522 [Brassica cretica]KAF2597687.1 hypothetical protein F2Q68_00009479 [Brassica cretica]